MAKNRLQTVTRKIERSVTGLNAAIYIHIEHDDQMIVRAVEFSHKWKEKESTLGNVLDALSVVVTEMIGELSD